LIDRRPGLPLSRQCELLGVSCGPARPTRNTACTRTCCNSTGRVHAAGALCSLDGRGRYLDNIFIERLWSALKYAAAYLRELRDGCAAESGIGDWFDFHNQARPHSSLGGRTPGEVYRDAAGRTA